MAIPPPVSLGIVSETIPISPLQPSKDLRHIHSKSCLRSQLLCHTLSFLAAFPSQVSGTWWAVSYSNSKYPSTHVLKCNNLEGILFNLLQCISPWLFCVLIELFNQWWVLDKKFSFQKEILRSHIYLMSPQNCAPQIKFKLINKHCEKKQQKMKKSPPKWLPGCHDLDGDVESQS